MAETTTLSEHIQGSAAPDATDLVVLLTQLAVAGKLVARELACAALVGQLGPTGITNVQGEAVKKLDAWANDVVVRALEETGLVSALVSEELDEPRRPATRGGRARYVVCIDPVDGSANLDVNGIVGTIFSIPRNAGAGDDARRVSGKLRLEYEAAPMAFLAEQAGGRASTGHERIMTIDPATPHARVPLVIGSPDDVAMAEDFIGGRQ